MALIWLDSFDDGETGSGKYNPASGNIGNPVGRTGNCVDLSGSRFSEGVLHKTFPERAAYIVGLAFRVSGAFDVEFLQFYDGAAKQVSLKLNANQTLSVVRGDGAILATSSQTVPLQVFAYIELKVTVGAAGSYTLRVNGATWLTGSAVNTDAAGSGQADGVRLYTPAQSSNIQADDYYICDLSGTANNDFLGAIHIECLRPSDVGTSTQWTPSAGSNFACVAETVPDDDSAYISAASPGTTDTYQMQDLSRADGVIVGVQTTFRARVDSEGSVNVATVLRSGSVEVSGTAHNVTSQTYADFTEIHELDPATSAAWTPSAVNALEAGVKVTG